MYTVIRTQKVHRLLTTVAGGLILATSALAGQTASVSGRLTVLDRGDRQARDVGQAVVWLESRTRHAVTPDTIQVLMSDKMFQPSVVVVPRGTTIRYPNTDGFNHNVFSLSPEGPFDLGLYGRGEARSTTLNQPGVLRVYCNVHARMSSFVVVRDNPFFTQPARDGAFTIENVPAGRYQLVAWHERAGEMSREQVDVGASDVVALAPQLDARGFKRVQHANKHGRPYSRRGRRY